MDYLTESDEAYNAIQIASVNKKVSAFLQSYDFSGYTSADFSQKLSAINQYSLMYIHREYVPAEGPSGSHEWGYSSGHGAYINHSRREGNFSLDIDDLAYGELIAKIIKAFDDYQYRDAHLEEFKEKRAAINASDLATFRDFEAFLDRVKLTEKDFLQHHMQTLEDIAVQTTQRFLSEEATPRKMANLFLTLTLKGFPELRRFLNSSIIKIKNDFRVSVEDVLNQTIPPENTPDITADYIRHGLITPVAGKDIQHKFVSAAVELRKQGLALKAFHGMPAESLKPIIVNIDYYRQQAVQAITNKFSAALHTHHQAGQAITNNFSAALHTHPILA